MMRVSELIHQTRLAHPGLPYQGCHLAVSRRRLCQRLLQRRQLGLPPHEGGEATRHCRLQAPPHSTGPDQLKDFDRRWQPF